MSTIPVYMMLLACEMLWQMGNSMIEFRGLTATHNSNFDTVASKPNVEHQHV